MKNIDLEVMWVSHFNRGIEVFFAKDHPELLYRGKAITDPFKYATAWANSCNAELVANVNKEDVE